MADEAINAVLDFWFVENGPKQWFSKDDAFDAAIRERFEVLVGQAAEGELSHWRASAKGALAEILILDQFPRNLYRGDDARAFASDRFALEAAKAALERKIDQELSESERTFLYLPFEHSEAAEDQETSLRLFGSLADKSLLVWAEKHQAIIDRFGRYPHRNAALGRPSTDAELAFLKEDGSSF
ncbi:MAG: DUF924 domain-containing protein [Proteobacteria bacterium]|nr:DUF924 domain-containing protein [Pseudomonadota bacterium]